MIIDTHCHFDMMPNPEQYLKQQEVKKNISIGMTNLDRKSTRLNSSHMSESRMPSSA